MPAILTLHSGAALARSSNLISATNGNPRDRRGRVLCLDRRSVRPAGRGGRVYDLGEPAYGRVAAINDHGFKTLPSRDGQAVSRRQMCEQGGTYFYRDRRHSWEGIWEDEAVDKAESTDSKSYVFRRRWQKVEVPKGVLVSATALTSFAGRVSITDI